MKVFLCSLLMSCAAGISLSADAPQQVDYQREVRRILSNHCYQCHGPDEPARQADLRLDLESGAIVELGGHAISRNRPESSALLERIFADDPDERMPPQEANKPLSDAKRDVLRRWVTQGAPWGRHWAYRPVERPPVPDSPNPEFGSGNPIDRFIRSRLEAEGVKSSSPADRVTLIRRLQWDLWGLPPNPEAVDAFVEDLGPRAIEDLVERLLASPHYGERMAMYWFDLVRFANTTGIHADNEWTVNPYRNWVIDALNANIPFDQFTREQLAGDLLPKATTEQKIAATYNRLNLSTREGGSQAKEFLAKYTADRVRNASSVWLASTMGCAECHDHKFDPVTTKEFYQFGAFFADIEQVGVYGVDFPPYLKLPGADQERELKSLTQGIRGLERVLEAQTPELVEAQHAWEAEMMDLLAYAPELSDWRSVGPFGAEDFDTAHDTDFGPEDDASADATYGDEDEVLAWVAQPEWKDGETHNLSGENAATYLYREIVSDRDGPLTLWFGSDDSLRVWFRGEEVLERKVQRGVAADQDKVSVDLEEGENPLLVKIANGGGGYGFHFRSSSNPVPESIQEVLELAAEERSDEGRAGLREHFRSITPLLEAERTELGSLKKQRKALDDSLERTLATVSVEPMTTRVLPRGNWMDESGEVVQPGVPAVMGGNLPKFGDRATRLDLADWLMAPENPLTARVFVNRLWMLFFGTGVADTVDDFGAQGEMPSHPELLDWLAVEFIESGWDIKHMVRLIVNSATYRQSSDARPDLQKRDPFNRLFARQHRHRIDAEMVRDMALSTSGLLNREVGGYESARPYQPAGYYRHLNFPKREYRSDEHLGQYRRGVYMHWQRQYLHPALQAFDAPTREECVARRLRSNTPLAALVMMNDPTIVEAARFFAERILEDGPNETEPRLRWAFRRALSREPREAELAVLSELFEEQRERFEADPEGSEAFVGVGLSDLGTEPDTAELAAWTMVTRSLLNLHEAILRF